MSDQITLELTARDTLGKGVKQLRKDGFVPAVIHDHGKASLHVQADYQSIYKAYQLAGKHHPVQVTADGKKYTTIIKNVTFDPHYNALMHVVFGAVSAHEKVEAEIPVHAVYAEGNESSPAERASLMVISNVSSVVVEATSDKLPDELTYDGEQLVQVGDHVTVAALKIPAGVELKTDPNTVIATVYEPSAVAAANDAAGGDAEPEDAATVESENESTAEEGTQADEIRPGGKEQKESKDQGQNPEKQ
jgi:large subunit ribosomal protein L25